MIQVYDVVPSERVTGLIIVAFHHSQNSLDGLLFSLHTGCYGTHQENLNSHNVKVAQKPFQTLRHIFAKPKDPDTKE